MGRIFVVEREGSSYRCKFCNTQLALADDLASRVCIYIYGCHFFLRRRCLTISCLYCMLVE